MNVPPRYTYCVLITAILAVIGYFIFPAMAIGVLIGGLVSFPIAYYIMGKATVAWFFIPPFLVSTIGGSIIAGLLIRSGVLSGISSTLLPLNKHKNNM